MYVLLWMNTWQPFIFFYQIFFIERIFVFFTPLSFLFFLFSSPHCHSRLHKTILKILSIYRKNILGKQLSQAICFKYVFRLLHAPNFQTFSTKTNMMVKVTWCLSKSGATVRRCSMEKLL